MLRRDGFESDRATHAYAAVHTYTVGFCALEATRHRARPTRPAPREPEPDGSRSMIEGFVTEEQFELGLDALIRGLGSMR